MYDDIDQGSCPAYMYNLIIFDADLHTRTRCNLTQAQAA